VTAPTHPENKTFTIRSSGTYHLISLNQTTLAYNQESRNCLRFYEMREGFEPVDECPEEAGTNSNQDEVREQKPEMIPVILASIAVLGAIAAFYIRS